MKTIGPENPGSLTEKSFFEDPLIRDALAAYAHRAWAGWMVYLFSKTFNHDPHSDVAVIPEALVARWRRQMATPYQDLPESEKASDLVEADKILALLKSHVKPSSPANQALLDVARNGIDLDAALGQMLGDIDAAGK